MTQQAWIGIDLGTSGCRAIAIDAEQHIICQTRVNAHDSLTTSEQSPEQQWLLVEQVLTQLFCQLSSYHINSIAVDATSGSVMLANKQGYPLTNMLMYNDARASKEAIRIAAIAPAESAAHGATSGLAKLLYLANAHLDSSACTLLHQADWINFKLGAQLGFTDYNNALKTGYDPVLLHWPDWLDQLHISQCLPKVVAPGTVIGKLSNALVEKWQLRNAPELIAGTTDSIAAFLATGAHQLGDAVTSLGSTLVLKLITEAPIFQPEQGIYSHKLGSLWLTGGASNSGGAVLKHFFSAEQLTELSKHINLDVTPNDYYPLLNPGERFPICDPNLPPKLSPRPPSDADFLHGLLNGIAHIEALAYQCLQSYGASTLRSIRTVGGGSVNMVWQTIRQRQIAVPFITPEQTEAAYGSALLAKNRLNSI